MTRPPENVCIFGISRREIAFYRLRRCDFVPKSPGGSLTLPYRYGWLFGASINSNYHPRNDTGHGSWVSITGQGGAILPAGASAQTAIYCAICKKRSVLSCSAARIVCIYSIFFTASLLNIAFWCRGCGHTNWRSLRCSACRR